MKKITGAVLGLVLLGGGFTAGLAAAPDTAPPANVIQADTSPAPVKVHNTDGTEAQSVDHMTGCRMMTSTWGRYAQVTYSPEWWEFWREPYTLDWYGYWCA